MIPSRIRCVLMLAVATVLPINFVSAQPGDPLRIVITEKTYRVGDKITAQITGRGDYLLENDLTRQSQQIKLAGATKIELGVIPKPGLYVVRVGGNGRWAAAALVATQGKPNKLDVRVGIDGGKDPSALPEGLAKRFAGGITQARLKAAALAALKEWTPANAAALGKTTVACGVCVVPTGQFACAACVGSATGNVLSLGVEVALQLISILETEKVLTAGEAKALKFALKSGSGLISIATGEEVIDKALSGLKFVADSTVEHDGLKLIVGNAADQVDKTLLLIKVTKK